MRTNKSILIFGTGPLQQSLIERCKAKGLFTVGIDPNPDAECKEDVDAFEMVSGSDYEKTIEVARKYGVSGIITAATDKPLVMMARVAEKLNLAFFSVETAEVATDKFLMKQRFMDAGLPCAKGFLISDAVELNELDMVFPIIVKPRDNSGSRGVVYCENIQAAFKAVEEALKFTNMDTVLVEEYLEGQEYSIEAIHYKSEHHVVQFTEKSTTDVPYNVEIGHVQPADIPLFQKRELQMLISKIGQSLKYENCASHTEVKVNVNGVYIIETSPRLGGDFITSSLVPLSTGFNMEDELIDLALRSYGKVFQGHGCLNKCSGVLFFQLPEGKIKAVGHIEALANIIDCQSYHFGLDEGQSVPRIKNSIDRYGYAIFQSENKEELMLSMRKCEELIAKEISIENYGSKK